MPAYSQQEQEEDEDRGYYEYIYLSRAVGADRDDLLLNRRQIWKPHQEMMMA